MLSTGAQGVLDAGLVALCVEKLVQEESTELKVVSSLRFVDRAIYHPSSYTGAPPTHAALVFPGGHNPGTEEWSHFFLCTPSFSHLTQCPWQCSQSVV